MKTAELTGAALDWAVAKCEGITDDRIVLQRRMQLPGEAAPRYEARVFVRWLLKEYTSAERWQFCAERYEPSTDWAVGGPVIEREKLDTAYLSRQSVWYCYRKNRMVDDHVLVAGFGPTPLIAAMRCYVSSKLGGEVDVPDELVS